MKKQKRQGSQYDKIFKENIEVVIPALMLKVLGITAVESEELPDDLLHTKERKPDVLKKITDEQNTTFVLQIEFQVSDEMEMVYQMAEYYIMLKRKYKLPVRQFVIFIGAGSPKMPTRLVSEQMQFNFPLVAFAELDYLMFLKSDNPEEIVLAILADFKQKKPETAIGEIVQRLRETTKGEFALRRYFQQLRVFSQLRNFQKDLKEITMDSLAKYVSMERDPLYMIGIERGEAKGKAKGEAKGEAKAEERFVRNLLVKMALTTEQVADVAGVSVEFVEEVKATIAAEK